MQALFDARDDVVVITGGANGIGAALAAALADAGATPVVFDVDAAAAARLIAARSRIQFFPVDVGRREQVFAAMQLVEDRFGRIDSLVCAAAIQPRVPVHETSPDIWNRVLDVNLNGVLWCYQAVVPGMIRRRSGSVVVFGSGLATTGWPEAAAYASTKAALMALARSAAREVAQFNVRVNIVAPGVIDTEQYRRANAGRDDAHWQRTSGVGVPDDVVGPLLFVLSEQATMTASLLSRDCAFPKRAVHDTGEGNA